MSGVATIAAVASAVAAVAGVAVSASNASEQASANKKAQSQQEQALQQQKAATDKTAADADRTFNAANRKSPNTAGILAATSQAGKQGASGTMLTGPTGVDPNALTLGKNSLLGGTAPQQQSTTLLGG